jgi:hypothetical protein
VQISHPPTTTTPPNEWIDTIVAIVKTPNKEARKITTKLYSKSCIKIPSNVRKKNPKKINRKTFKHSETSPLDSITDRQNNILINHEDIAKKIHIQQSISNHPIVHTYHYQNKHPPHCTCGVRQYPWHDLEGLTID